MNMIAALEGLLFLSGDKGLTCNEIAEILEINIEEVEKLAHELSNEYQEKPRRGIQLEKYGNTYKLVTKSQYNVFYEKLVQLEESKPLTTAALEVLAIIAYNQPITRNQVDEIRGVSSSHMIRKLLAKELIYEAGRSELPGRPIIYKTTDKFLDTFGIKSLDELPPLKLIDDEEIDENDLFKSKYVENE